MNPHTKSGEKEPCGISTAQILHDINNMISVIRLNAELLQQSLQNSETLPDPEKTTTTTRCQNILDACQNALAISKRATGEKNLPPSYNFQEILEKTIRLAEVHTPQLCEIKLIHPKEIKSWSSPFPTEELQEILHNLLKNATEAIKRNPTPQPHQITLKCEESQYHIHLLIEDDGPGIPPSIQKKIFLENCSTKKQGNNLTRGLGLIHCHKLAKTYNGNLTLVESTPGKTIFQVTIPKTKQGLTVLIIEDDPQLRYTLEKLLEIEKIQTLLTSCTKEGLELLQNHPAPIHVVLCDHSAQGENTQGEITWNGAEFEEEVRKRGINTPIILMSGIQPTHLRENQPFLQKPFLKEDLIRTINTALAK